MIPDKLKGAIPRPNAGESYFSYENRFKTDPILKNVDRRTKEKICPRCFNYYATLNLKNRDLQFFTSIERRIQSIINKYAGIVEKEIDKIFQAVGIAISNGRDWEHLVNNHGIMQAVKANYNETGLFINEKYAKRYGGIVDPILVELSTPREMNLRFSKIEDPFNNQTRKTIETAVSNNQEVREIKNTLRAQTISKTETGIGQAIAERYTMEEVSGREPLLKYWVGRIDDKIRDTHLSATQRYNESNLIPFNELFYVNGNAMRHPRDYEAPSSETANCRCYLGYVVTSI